MSAYLIEGASGKRGEVSFENLGDNIVGIKQLEFWDKLNYCNIF